MDLRARIPKMLIQIFTENAPKHGISHKKGKGLISIHAYLESESTIIEIKDNGIGFKKAEKNTSGKKGKGLIILQNYLELFREQYKKDISFTINEIKNSNQTQGTKVVICIPQ